mgnify:CR=1 FL=1
MITQYSHQQITLSDREKEYAWFHYAAQIINAGCMDPVSYTHLRAHET